MSTVMGTGGFANLLKPGLQDVILEVGKERPREYPNIVNVVDLDWNPATDQQMAGLGAMQDKPQGNAFRLDRPLLGNQKTWDAQPKGLAIEFTYEMWRDEKYGIAKAMTAELGRSGRHAEELDAISPFNNAFSTSFTGFDTSKSLCSTTHTTIGGGVVSNRSSTDVAFGITGIQTAILRFEDMVNHRGLPRLMRPTKFLLGTTNRFVAREILGSTNKPYTSDSEINALIEDDLSYIVSHYLAVKTNWFLMAARGEHRINFCWRDRPIFDGYDDPRTKNAIFTLYQRHVAGFSSYEGVDGSNA